MWESKSSYSVWEPIQNQTIVSSSLIPNVL